MKRFLVFLLLLCPVTLHAQNTTGFIKFEFTNADSAYMVPAYDLFEAINVASGDSLPFVEGINLITLQTHFDKSESLNIRVFKDSTVTFSYTFDDSSFNPTILTNNIAARNYYDANVMVLTDEDSDIYFEGNYKGTGFAKFNTFGEIGTLEIRNPDFGNESSPLNIPAHIINFIRNDLRPDKSMARIYSIFPGASQSYKSQHLKAVLLATSTLSLFTYAGLKSHKYQDELDVFYEYQEKYNNAGTEQEALRLGD